MSHPLVRKLSYLEPLTQEEVDVLLEGVGSTRVLPPHTQFVREGDHPTHCCLIVEGFACRYKITPGGSRQILSFQIAGDLCDLQSLSLKRMDHGISTVTECIVAFVPHQTVSHWIERYPRLSRALWRDALLDAAVFREWIVNLGVRPAYQRLAHLLCEVLVRMESVGLANGWSYKLPLTQADLAAAVGVSSVHMNRMIQKLRHEGLITFRSGTLTVEDLPGLQEVGDFDAAYLQVAAAA